MTREKVLEEALRVAGAVNNLIPNMESHVKDANQSKPLDAARKQHVQKVQEYVKRLKDERVKLDGIIKTFKALSPNVDSAKQKPGIRAAITQKLGSDNRANKALLTKMEGALKDIDTAIKNGNELKIADWKPLNMSYRFTESGVVLRYRIFREQKRYADNHQPSARCCPQGRLRWTDRSIKTAKKRVVELRKGGSVALQQAWEELNDIQSLYRTWENSSRSSSVPFIYPGLEALENAGVTTRKEIQELQKIVSGSGWDKLSFDTLTAHIRAYAADTSTPYRMLTLSGIESELNAIGVGRLLDDLRLRMPATVFWARIFDHAWLNSALDEMAIQNPDVKGFVGATHDGYIEEFKRLDSDRLKLAKDRVRRLHAERTIAAMNQHPDQEALIKQQAAKTRGLKPLREVFQKACEVMTAVCPCWMASPLSVAQLIHQDVKFDYVIFDEASQILPEDAIPSIRRGKYVIVAGDNKQLPPTGFFASGNDDDQNESAVVGFESLRT